MAVANFLTKVCNSENISSAATLGPIRSAICTTLKMVTGEDVSQSPWVHAVMQAAANLKPARPRYDSHWDLELLLEYWESQPPNTALPLSDLLDKCLSLLMAAGIMRSSDLHRIAPETIQFTRSSVSFRLLNPKNAKGLSQPVVINSVDSRPSVCPVRCFKAYMAALAPLRSSTEQKKKVWLGSRRPHIPILPKTIASRVLRTLDAAGVDTKLFKAHSVRLTAVSRAVEQGAALQEVMQHGRWRSEKVFLAFYERSVRTGAVSSAIMS